MRRYLSRTASRIVPCVFFFFLTGRYALPHGFKGSETPVVVAVPKRLDLFHGENELFVRKHHRTDKIVLRSAWTRDNALRLACDAALSHRWQDILIARRVAMVRCPKEIVGNVGERTHSQHVV